MKKKIIIFIVIAAVIGAGSFFGGLAYGKTKAGAVANQFRQQRQAGANNGQFRLMGNGQLNQNGGRGNFINGEIISKDNNSVTIKDQNNGTKLVFLSGNTQISKFTAGNIADLIVGQNVLANGAANSDGSLTAQMIQLRPDFAGNATSTPK